MSRRTRVLIADDARTRLGIRLAVGGAIDVCAEARDAGQAVTEANRTQPDVCIVGVQLAGGAIAAIRGILAVAARASVLVLASDPNPRDFLAATRAGACGYVPARIEAESLRRMLDAAAAGEAVVPRGLVSELMLELREAPASTSAGLTRRELRVLRLLRNGCSTAAMAEDLGISPVTVRRHISGLKRKLAVEGREGLIAVPER